MARNTLIIVIAIALCIGGAVGSLLTYLSRSPDQEAIDAALAGEECCAALRQCQDEMDKGR